MRIYELMSRDVVSVRPTAPLKEVARILAEHRISGVPVVNEAGEVLGVVSETDFMLKELGRDHVRHSPLHWLLGDRDARHDLARVEAITAGEAMTSPPITIEGRRASIREAAIVMARHGINRLPITEEGRLVGIITRADVLGVYTQGDDQLENAIREQLRGVDGLTVDSVRDGIVTLSGALPSDVLRRSVIQITEAIDGVVAVDVRAVSSGSR